MKFQKIIFLITFISFLAISCKNEPKKEVETSKEQVAEKIEEASFAISGMTCEIGCAKTIASKLSKKEGVLEAKVIFNDSTAVVKYDANKTNKEDLIAFIDGIADGNTYKTSEITTQKMSCGDNCKKECCNNADKKTCSEECKKECCTQKDGDKTACTPDCKKECCAKKA